MTARVRLIISMSLTFTVVAMVDDQPYCAGRYKRLCQGKGRHIACQFPDPGPGPSCENYTEIRFTNQLKIFILHYINRRRQRIASGNERVRGGLHLPKPEVMMLVEWDRELALLAQRLADQCHFVHDDCRATVRYPYSGQTVGEVRWRRSSESDELSAQRAIRRVFDAWWGERRRVQPRQLTAPFKLAARGAVWGHFSQLAVWTLQAVGCGAVRHGISYPHLLLVCDFSHTNMLGQRTISPGPLSPCPIHTVRRPRSAYPLLCAPVRHPIPSESDSDSQDADRQYDDDDSEDLDIDSLGVTVEVGDMSSPGQWYTRPFTRNEKITVVVKEMPPLQFREDIKAQTRGSMVEKLDQELETRNKDHKAPEEETFHHWQTRNPFGHLRENEEILEEVIPLKTQKRILPIKVDDPRVLEYYRPTSMTSTEQHPVRQRWKQTRFRPRRPGAMALIDTKIQSQTVKQSRKPTVASLMMDTEDMDQLFIDTGFRVRWKEVS